MDTSTATPVDGLAPATVEFYRHTLLILKDAGVPLLVGGAYAFACYTEISRHTKDFDLFIRPEDLERALEALAAAGYRTDITFPHWLAKAYKEGGEDFIDLIYRSGNGVSEVDDLWFERAREDEVFGVRVMLCPPEEIIWSKAFIMERERFDGADVAHLLRGCVESLDPEHLLHRFGEHWRVLLSHLVLFGYIYPSERGRIPRALMDELVRRLQVEVDEPAPEERLCRGTFLSRAQYLPDVKSFGYRDARLRPGGPMSAREIKSWTRGIKVDGPERAD